jgi:hypothetical protein
MALQHSVRICKHGGTSQPVAKCQLLKLVEETPLAALGKDGRGSDKGQVVRMKIYDETIMRGTKRPTRCLSPPNPA